jgi:hypothetical protein
MDFIGRDSVVHSNDEESKDKILAACHDLHVQVIWAKKPRLMILVLTVLVAGQKMSTNIVTCDSLKFGRIIKYGGGLLQPLPIPEKQWVVTTWI